MDSQTRVYFVVMDADVYPEAIDPDRLLLKSGEQLQKYKAELEEACTHIWNDAVFPPVSVSFIPRAPRAWVGGCHTETEMREQIEKRIVLVTDEMRKREISF